MSESIVSSREYYRRLCRVLGIPGLPAGWLGGPIVGGLQTALWYTDYTARAGALAQAPLVIIRAPLSPLPPYCQTLDSDTLLHHPTGISYRTATGRRICLVSDDRGVYGRLGRGRQEVAWWSAPSLWEYLEVRVAGGKYHYPEGMRARDAGSWRLSRLDSLQLWEVVELWEGQGVQATWTLTAPLPEMPYPRHPETPSESSGHTEEISQSEMVFALSEESPDTEQVTLHLSTEMVELAFPLSPAAQAAAREYAQTTDFRLEQVALLDLICGGRVTGTPDRICVYQSPADDPRSLRIWCTADQLREMCRQLR